MQGITRHRGYQRQDRGLALIAENDWGDHYHHDELYMITCQCSAVPQGNRDQLVFRAS